MKRKVEPKNEFLEAMGILGCIVAGATLVWLVVWFGVIRPYEYHNELKSKLERLEFMHQTR